VSEGSKLPVAESARRILREMGLNNYEVDAYAALAESGQLTAMETSKKTSIPYSKVYDALNSLKQKGWLKSLAGRPIKYYPLPPLEAMAVEKLRLEDQQRNWEQVIATELQPLYEKQAVIEHSDILVLRSQESIMEKLAELLRKADQEIVVAAPEFAKVVATSANQMLDSLRKERMRIRIMVSGKTADWKTLRAGDSTELRLRDTMFGGGVIVDSREAMLFLGEDKPSLVIWSNHPGLVRFARDYFEFLWNSSEKWK
jgi:sugar-specific transcriptional regulator TrmB